MLIIIVLLNGRTIGDLAGNYTFFGNGCSVIDLAVVDDFLLQKIMSFKVHNLMPDISSHCRIETILSCSPIRIPENDPTVQNLVFTKYIWNKESSLKKLQKSCETPEFLALQNKILTTNYVGSSVELLCNDVHNAFTLLHEQSCDKVPVGRRSHTRAKAKRQKWFTPDLIQGRE